ncbi:hypothetical protein U2A4042610036 [Corynebacterium striatum]|nr:hypothetical protein U2A4042610036 [Corynebacterium striatum]
MGWQAIFAGKLAMFQLLTEGKMEIGLYPTYDGWVFSSLWGLAP